MRKLRIGLLTALAVAGCSGGGGGTVIVDFDPLGGTGEVEAVWTIDGIVPDAAGCAALGASRVRLEVWDAATDGFYTDASWEADCNTPGGFTTGPVLSPDTYRLRLLALSGSTVVSSTPYEMVRIDNDTIVTLDGDFPSVPVTGTDATLAGSWEIDGVTANAASCAAAGIDEVVLSIANDPAGTDIEVEYVFDCAQGFFDSRTDGSGVTVPMGPMFFSQWYAEAADDSVLAESPWLELQVVAPTTHADLAVPNFPGGTTLIVNLFWDTGAGYGTCAEAAVDTMGYELYDSVDVNPVFAEFDIPCQDQLIFDDPAVDIYELGVTGDATDGTKWGITCTGLTVDRGMVTYDCSVDIDL